MKQRINASSGKHKKYPSSDSIVQVGATADNKDDMFCFISGSRTGLEVHHIFNGPKRTWSDENGCWVYLNHDVHMALHQHHPEWALWLKQQAEKAYLEDHTLEEFIKAVGKNYL